MRKSALIAAAFIVAVFSAISSHAVYAAPSKKQLTATPKVAKTQTTSVEATQPKKVEVTIQPGDYLAKIAEAHSTTYMRIYQANDTVSHPDLIYPGQVLRIPAPEEQLQPRELPVDAVVPAAEQGVTPAQAAAPVAQAAPVSLSGDVSVWDRLAQCEASGNWAINTGNGYYGGLQFTLSSWRAVGGAGYPHQASREEQIMRGQMLQARQGWGAWPACTAKLGLR